jgi:hypothetical protein
VHVICLALASFHLGTSCVRWEGRHAFFWRDFHRVGYVYIVSFVSGWPSLYVKVKRAENLRKVWYEGVGIKIENPMTKERRKVRQQQLNLFAPTNISL